MKANEDPIVVEQTYAVPVDAVWRAISERDQMVRWYFDVIPDFEAKVGFSTKFDIQVEDRVYPHVWDVTEVVPQERLAYQWHFEGWDGAGVSTFELSEQGGSTHLKVTFQATEDFQEGVPEFSREACTGGWTWFLQESLKKYLEDGD